MRKIKFRAWSVGTNAGEMIYLDRLNLTGDSVGWADDENGTEYEISDKCPLMQFTGLFDKSGKEIWEGDICKYSEWDADCAYGKDESRKKIGEIYWDEIEALFSLDRKKNYRIIFDNNHISFFFTLS